MKGGRDSGEVGSGNNQQDVQDESQTDAGFLVLAFRELSSCVLFWVFLLLVFFKKSTSFSVILFSFDFIFLCFLRYHSLLSKQAKQKYRAWELNRKQMKTILTLIIVWLWWESELLNVKTSVLQQGSVLLSAVGIRMDRTVRHEKLNSFSCKWKWFMMKGKCLHKKSDAFWMNFVFY